MGKWWFVAAAMLFVAPLLAQNKDGDNARGHLLRWRFVDGLSHVYEQTTVSEITRYTLDEEKNPLPQKPNRTKAAVSANMHWQIEKTTGEGQLLVAIRFKKGMMKFQENDRKDVFRLEDPLDRQKVRHPLYAGFAALGMDGLAFLLDPRKQEVLATWHLKEVGGGQYQKILLKGGPDPLGIADTYNMLPGKAVPIGHTWQASRREANFVYDSQYRFVQMTTYRGRQVAQIKVTTTVKVGEQEIGSESGDYFFDCQRGLMVAQRIQKNKKIRFTVQADKNTPAANPIMFLEETATTIKSELVQTNG